MCFVADLFGSLGDEGSFSSFCVFYFLCSSCSHSDPFWSSLSRHPWDIIQTAKRGSPLILQLESCSFVVLYVSLLLQDRLCSRRQTLTFAVVSDVFLFLCIPHLVLMSRSWCPSCSFPWLLTMSPMMSHVLLYDLIPFMPHPPSSSLLWSQVLPLLSLFTHILSDLYFPFCPSWPSFHSPRLLLKSEGYLYFSTIRRESFTLSEFPPKSGHEKFCPPSSLPFCLSVKLGNQNSLHLSEMWSQTEILHQK